MSINSMPLAPSKPQVNFDWTPRGGAFNFVAGGITFPYNTQQDAVVRASDVRYVTNTTPTNTLLSFTANLVVPGDISIIEYRWDFGDGGVAFGPIAQHTYLVAASQTRVSLTVRDNLGRSFYRHRFLLLYPSQTVVLAGGTISV